MINLKAMISQLQEEKEALDSTIASLEQQLARRQNRAAAKPNRAPTASSETIAPRGRDQSR